MKKKVLIVLFCINKAQEHEWFVEFIDRHLFDIEFVLINSKDSPMDLFLKEHHVKTWNFNYSGKKDLPILTWNLYKLMIKNSYDVVHTHLFEANLAGLTAAYLARVPKRILTRHHSDFHHIYFPSSVKYDKYTNRLSTDIVAISENVKNILEKSENVPTSKIHLIHHGIDMRDYFPGAVNEERIQKIRNTYNLHNKSSCVVGVISRFIELKGLQYLIPAF